MNINKKQNYITCLFLFFHISREPEEIFTFRKQQIQPQEQQKKCSGVKGWNMIFLPKIMVQNCYGQKWQG